MNSRGNILAMEEVLKLSKKEQEDFIPIEEHEYQNVHNLPKPQRRAWYELNKSKYEPHQGMGEKLRRLAKLNKKQ